LKNKSLQSLLDTNAKNIAVLIDPDKQKESISLSDRCKALDQLSIDFVFVGGSTGSNVEVEQCIQMIKTHTDKPIVLFPGNNQQICNLADALLLLNLISGRNPEYLISQHVQAAPILSDLSMEVISTSYILIDGGRQSSVSYVSQTNPIPQNQVGIAVNTALAGKLIGHKCIFFDAGSGAKHTVSAEIISETKRTTNQPILVGGGITSLNEIETLFNAGANTIVVGNKLENNLDFAFDISNFMRSLKNQNI
jgi:phosphoglycerol geranylgeranyltransferase